MSKMQINEIGEFRLLHEIIFPIIKEVSKDVVGDDTAIINIAEQAKSLVITTDAGPKPLVMNLGYRSYYAWGWYTIAVNISDLASAGSEPLTVSLSIDAPNETLVSEIQELFEGIKDACKHFNVLLSGGNIRASKYLATHCTAIGILEANTQKITRRNCKPGHVILNIGYAGRFISNYLKAELDGLESLTAEELDSLIKPDCSVNEMKLLSKQINFSAASDNSDGILGALWNISEKSGCGFEIDFDNIEIPSYIKVIANRLNYNPYNLLLFWGDWQVIATIPESELEKFIDVASDNKIEYTILGKAVSEPILLGVLGGKGRELELLRNENFTTLSYNNVIANHVDYLLKTPLFKD